MRAAALALALPWLVAADGWQSLAPVDGLLQRDVQDFDPHAAMPTQVTVHWLTAPLPDDRQYWQVGRPLVLREGATDPELQALPPPLLAAGRQPFVKSLSLPLRFSRPSAGIQQVGPLVLRVYFIRAAGVAGVPLSELPAPELNAHGFAGENSGASLEVSGQMWRLTGLSVRVDELGDMPINTIAAKRSDTGLIVDTAADAAQADSLRADYLTEAQPVFLDVRVPMVTVAARDPVLRPLPAGAGDPLAPYLTATLPPPPHDCFDNPQAIEQYVRGLRDEEIASALIQFLAAQRLYVSAVYPWFERRFLQEAATRNEFFTDQRGNMAMLLLLLYQRMSPGYQLLPASLIRSGGLSEFTHDLVMRQAAEGKFELLRSEFVRPQLTDAEMVAILTCASKAPHWQHRQRILEIAKRLPAGLEGLVSKSVEDRCEQPQVRAAALQLLATSERFDMSWLAPWLIEPALRPVAMSVLQKEVEARRAEIAAGRYTGIELVYITRELTPILSFYAEHLLPAYQQPYREMLELIENTPARRSLGPLELPLRMPH